jgi:hypothetical protein
MFIIIIVIIIVVIIIVITIITVIVVVVVVVIVVVVQDLREKTGSRGKWGNTVEFVLSCIGYSVAWVTSGVSPTSATRMGEVSRLHVVIGT